jgi:hypothetical protein
MTESISEVRAALAAVAESLGSADRHARIARERLEEAVAVLTALDGEHSESLVPPQLHRASEVLDHGLVAIGGGRDAVADLDARL